MDAEIKRVLFVSAPRDEPALIAAGLFNRAADRSRAVGIAAVAVPEEPLKPQLFGLLREAEVPPDAIVAVPLNKAVVEKASLVVAIADPEAVPIVKALAPQEVWVVDDPITLPPSLVRSVLDDLAARVKLLLMREGVGPCSRGEHSPGT